MAESSPASQPTSPDAAYKLIKLERLTLEDESFRFRAALRIGPLKDSIADEGQVMPIVVRKVPNTRPLRFQVISGFRRATAMRELGLDTIKAIVRDDLDDDEKAFRASVLENSQRKTYSDIDRALVIKSYEDRGWSGADIQHVMGVSKRQAINLKNLLDLPTAVQAAIDDPATAFTATHGIALKALGNKYEDLEFGAWVERIIEDGLSVAQLKRAVNKAHRSDEPKVLGSIFRANETDPNRSVFRLQPMLLDLERLGSDDVDRILEEVKTLAAAILDRKRVLANKSDQE